MQDRPNAAELLRIARESLLDALVPLLPAERKLDALIIANVMAIAAREAEFGEMPRRHELARLAALYGEEAPSDADSATLAAAVERLTRRLAADLRRGAFDDQPARFAEVKAHLVEITLQKLRENNPRYLGAEGLS
ncbi:MAG: DUF6285 domain-containing protein [Alphaproteobacteria bacterium]